MAAAGYRKSSGGRSSRVRADPARRLEWAIVHEGRVSGGIELRFRDDFERLTGPGAAEVGYSLARPLWGRGARDGGGVGGHRARLRDAAAGAHLGLRRRAQRRVVRGERVDDVLYALLREEWGGAG